MKIEDCFYLGVITRRHGLKGNFLIKIDTDQPELYTKMRSFYILIPGGEELLPVVITHSKIYKQDILNVLPEETSEAYFNSIKGAEVYLPISQLPPLKGTQFFYHEVIGFEIIDTLNGNSSAGEIVRINENVPQPYFITQLNNMEINVPIIQEWIEEIDRENKKIKIALPEGLIEVFI